VTAARLTALAPIGEKGRREHEETISGVGVTGVAPSHGGRMGGHDLVM
jgi:hypothetical protein